LFIGCVALIFAAAAGAAAVSSSSIDEEAAYSQSQPLMSLLFGNLVQEFVNFATVTGLAAQGNQEAAARVPEVAANFRRVAGLDATYLVYIGWSTYL
jgi:ATP-binding cassette, subfamily B (MDR/TAP), member 1